MVEKQEWKKNIAKEYIQKNVLTGDFGDIINSINSLKDEISGTLGNEGKNNEEIGGNTSDFVITDKILKILFNNKGKQRTETGYELSKTKSIAYYLISEEGKKNLDILYNEMQKAESETELKQKLGLELNNLYTDIQSNNGTDNKNSANLENNNSIEFFNVDENYIYGKCKEYGLTDKDQIAYVLATVKGESGFKNIKERGGENRKYGKIDPSTGKAYYGRGYVQLTFKSNYQKFTDYIKQSGLSFKDNQGNVLSGEKLDLVKNPDTILESNDLAAYILITGMIKGSFTGKKLDDFIGNGKKDFYHARSIINGMSSSPKKYEKHANDYADKILNSSENSKINNKTDTSIEGSKELLAKNRNELGGIGSSIMYGMEKDGNNSFKNMDGKISGTTTNKKRFKEEGNELFYNGKELGQYCKDNGIKSFMFYFGGNEASHSEQEVNKAYENIQKWGNYLQSKGIQPVLCTCIYENIKSHSVGHKGEIYPLPGFNQKIRNLGSEKKWPVIDFAKIDNEIEISSDKLHPSQKGYKRMRQEIGI